MTNSLRIDVKSYEEEFEESTNSSVTVYIVVVGNTTTNSYYQLRKRYSEFAGLHYDLKLRFPELESKFLHFDLNTRLTLIEHYLHCNL